MKKILFVCLGNICRSPMAEGLLKKMRSDFSVSSAGVSSMDGWHAMPEAVEVMKGHGVDISRHVAKPVREEFVMEADLVLAMTRRHKKMLISRYPDAEDKIFTLREYAGTGVDIADPYGRSKRAYETAAREIAEALEKADFD